MTKNELDNYIKECVNDNLKANLIIGAVNSFNQLLDDANVKQTLPLTNQKIWDMAKIIVDRQKAAKDIDFKKVDTNSLEEDWFDWLHDELFGDDVKEN